MSCFGKFLKLILMAVTGLGLLCSSCGKRPVAAQQPISKLEIPEWPAQSNGHSLASDSVSESYQGNIVMWAQNASAAGIGGVISASANNRKKMAALTQFRRTEITPREAVRAQIVQRISESREAAKLGSILRQREMSANWFEQKLASGLGNGRITEVEAERARSIFDLYCEAKIWEIVSYRISGNRTAVMWGDRPSPAWMCENVYRKRELFLDSEAANCSAAGSGSTYEQCLWKNGVFKTSFFLGRYDLPFVLKPDQIKSAKFSEWVDDKTFNFHFFESESPVRIRSGFMENKKVRPGSLLNVGPVVNRDFSDLFVPVSGEPMDQKVAGLAQMSPWYLINEIEEPTLGLGKTGEFSLAPAALLIDGAEQDPRKAELLNELRAGLSAMHRRTSEAASLGDVLLNKSLVALSEPIDLSKLRATSVISPIVDAIDSDSIKKMEELERDERLMTAEIEAARKAAIPMEEEWIAALNRGALAAVADGVSEAFFATSSLKLKRVHGSGGQSPGSYIDVRFVVDKGAGVLSACWDVGELNKQIECPESVRAEIGSQRIPARLEMDVTKSKLVLSTTIGDSEALGFRVKLGSLDQVVRADGFNNIDLSELKDGVFELELFGNVVDGMPFFTGKAFLKDAHGQKVHEGASSLMPYNK